MNFDQYSRIRQVVLDAGYVDEVDWAQNVRAPESPRAFAREYVWVVLNSGLRNQVAQGIWAKLRPVLETGGRASEVYGHEQKAAAIDDVWDRQGELFNAFCSVEDKLAFCESLPWIGPITKFHLAKNLGDDVAKPDRHLERVADVSGEGVQELCQRLADASGNRIGVVDLVIWRACNLGVLSVRDSQLVIVDRPGQLL